MSAIPYVGFSNSTLDALPDIKVGDKVTCPQCHQQHIVTESNPPYLLFYECNGRLYLAGVKGKNTMNTRADVASVREAN